MSAPLDSIPDQDFTVLVLAPLSAAQAAALRISPFGPFTLLEGPDAVTGLQQPVWSDDTVLIFGPTLSHTGLDAGSMPDDQMSQEAERAAADIATVFVAEAAVGPALLMHWLARGAQDVMVASELAHPGLGLRLRAAIERKRIDRQGRKSYATDLDTGLPHQQQLLEHMSHLLALREREPSPMAVLVLRVEGLTTVEARMGRDAANALRRKVGVRLRAGVRASDVVASVGDDSFAVLLGSMLLPTDASRVGAKLLATTIQPFRLAGGDVALAAALGVAQYPEDGTQPDALLRRALGLAASAAAQGRLGHANFTESGGAPASAANDD